ncbi:MFS transporter [Sporolactobacillus inulinus]|uniref:Major facilitator superfamily (MFS) profile domain-containing protein n=1 Tax=Sporolactobacillus inulinus CASD TaxID=1069536 RepID=A0A0U1QLR7_9BACL|nr:MFS transporter [Sporolactobacillus inulinus]KLI01749.1 hypothetical protein SINU_11785 [Sporolactobacillus inulinus CASD]GEB78382.1 MFS transporter [Sporolactobacillus inulinus]
MWRSLHPNLKIRLITSVMTIFVSDMIFPFMAMYFSQFFGATLAGFLLFINVIISVLSGFIGGYLSDRFGRKKIMVLAQMIKFLSLSGMTIANSQIWFSPLFTFLMLGVENVASGLMHPSEEAMLIDVSTDETRRFMYTINYWVTNLGMAAGAAIGGMFFNSHRFTLFLLVSAFSLVILGLIVFCIKEVYHQLKNIDKNISIYMHYLHVVNDKPFILFCIGSLLILSLECQSTNYIAVYLKKAFKPIIINHWFELDSYMMISWMRIENTLIVVFLTLIVTRFIKKYSAYSVLFVGLSIYSLGYAMQTLSIQWFGLVFAVLIASVGELMYVPISQSLLAALTKDKSRASYMAIYSSVFQVTKMFGALGIIIGSFLPSYIMGLIFFCVGLIGLKCYLKVGKKVYVK